MWVAPQRFESDSRDVGRAAAVRVVQGPNRSVDTRAGAVASPPGSSAHGDQSSKTDLAIVLSCMNDVPS